MLVLIVALLLAAAYCVRRQPEELRAMLAAPKAYHRVESIVVEAEWPKLWFG